MKKFKDNGLRDVNTLGFLILIVMMVASLLYFTDALDMQNINLIDKDVYSFSEGWTWQGDEFKEKYSLPHYFDVDKTEPLVIRNTIPDELPNGAKIALKSYFNYVVAKIDGETVYAVGDDSDKFLGKDFGNFWAVIDISPEDKGKTVELTLFSHLPASKGYASEVVIASGTGLLGHIFMQKGAWNVLSLITILLGFVLVFGCILGRIYKQKNRGLLFLGTTALLMGSWFLGDSGMLQLLTKNTYFVTRITFFSTILSPISFSLYIKETIQMTKKRFLADFFTLLVIVNAIICMTLEYLDILGIRDTLPISMIFITVLVIYYIVIFIIELFYYNNKKATNEIRALVIYLVFAILETVVFMINNQKGSSYFMLTGATIYIILALFNRYKEYTERRKIKEDKEYFERVAFTDALTGGGNRAGFYRDLETISDPEGYFIIQADTDRLKYINDYFGHSSGDLAIIDTYSVLNRNFSNIGKVYRIGGDEFSVIVKNADRDDIIRIIEQVKKDVDLISEEREYDFSVSFGAIMYDSSLDRNINATIVRADHKMYEDKKRLRGTLPQKMPVI